MRKKSVIIKYLLSYLAVLLIPFMVSYYFITHNIFETMKEELKKSNVYNVQQLQFGFDSCVEQMNAIVTQFSLNDTLHVKSNLQDINSAMLLKPEFEHYMQISDFLAEIGLYIQNDQYIFTSRTSLKPYLYSNLLLVYEDDMKSEFSEAISARRNKTLPSSKVMFYNQEEEFVTFIRHVPVIHVGVDEPSNLIFWWKTEYLREMANVEGTTLEYMVLDSEQREIFSTITQEHDMQGIYEKAKAGNTSFEYMDQLVAVQESSYSGMSFISITALDSVYAAIDKTSTELLVVTLLIFLIGAIVIFLAMSITYKPIAHVSRKILEYVPDKREDKNEIQFIEESLEYLVNKNKKLLHRTKGSSRIFLLRKVLQGAITSIDEFNALGEEYQLHLNKEYFSVLSVVFYKNNGEVQIDIDKLEVLLNQYFSGYIFVDLQAKYTFIINLREQEVSILQDVIYQVSQVLHQEYKDVQICVAVGNVYKTIGDVAKSYAEAVVAADYRFVKGMDSIIFQQDLVTTKNITYPYYLLEKFQASFQNQNEKTTQETLDEMVEYIRKINCPIHYARSICYDLISILSSALHNMGERELMQKVEGYYNKILADTLTVEEMIEISRNICTNVQAYVQADNQQKASQMIRAIKSEIKKKCYDVNFSVESLADTFDMTFPGISTLYKNKTGQTIIEYVTELRMERAKYYLLNTDLSVANITEEIGYVSPSSFIRKFKGIYGVTPKQYASNNKSSKNSKQE